MLIEELMNRGKKVVRETIEAGRKVAPMIFIEVEPSSVMCMEFKDKDPKADAFKKSTINRFILMARMLGKFKGAVVVAEAWISRNAEYQKAGKMPSMDPLAEDTAICVAYEANQKRMASAPVFEKGNKRYVGDFEEYPLAEAKVVQFWTDPGFAEFKPLSLDGYFAAGSLYDRLFELITKQSATVKN